MKDASSTHEIRPSLPGVQCHEPDSSPEVGGSDAHCPSVEVTQVKLAEGRCVPAG